MLRILIVDDDEQMRNLIRQHLTGTYEVFDTGNQAGGFLMTLQHKPDAILLDLSMPGISGFDFCRTLSSLAITQRIPILVISGQDARNEAFCKSLGAAGYVKKPIDFKRLKILLVEKMDAKKAARRIDVKALSSVSLRVKGKDKDDKNFEADAVAETMSVEGFDCACTTELDDGATFAISLAGGTDLHLGSACIVRIEGATPNRRYHFKFVERALGGEESKFREASLNVSAK